jgi:hydroxyacylglutathione hydrolase
MKVEVKTLKLGGVNCYLANCETRFVLIDTAYVAVRSMLVRALRSHGCVPGNLSLVVITHGDVDHVGNAAFLQRVYGAKIAMHPGDVGMVQHKDMGWGRKRTADSISFAVRLMCLLPKIFKAKTGYEAFDPDFLLNENFDLADYGLDAKIVSVPGHSKGSIGILTGKGDFYCGDLFYNVRAYRFIDDMTERTTSINKLKTLPIKAIYPGHGKPFLGGSVLLGEANQ